MRRSYRWVGITLLIVLGISLATVWMVRREGKNKALFSAVRAGNAQECARLLNAGADPNTTEWLEPGPQGVGEFLRAKILERGQHRLRKVQSVLMIAASNVDIDCVRLLIAHGADVNYQDDIKYTALMYACMLGRDSQHEVDKSVKRAAKLPLKEVIQALLDAGADPNKSGNEWGYTGISALMLVSTWTERTDCLDLLLQRGAVLDAQDYIGVTAMWHALNARHSCMANALLDHGAQPDIYPTEVGDPLASSLGKAFLMGDNALTKRLIAGGARVNAGSGDGDAGAIMCAAAMSHGDLLEFVLARNPRAPRSFTVFGMTALQAAKQFGDLDNVATLQRHGYVK